MMRLCETNYLAILVLCAVLVLAIQARSPPRRDACWNYKCPRGQVCKVMPIRCIKAPCPGDTPTCVKFPSIPHSGTCPKPVPGVFGICVVRCFSDDECGIGQKCCGGCPRECKNVSGVIVKPGRCPFDVDLPWLRSKSSSRRCRRSCSYDGDCPRNLKCCKVGRCGKTCLRPSRIYW
ncbi:perlwapin-like [Gigantopelta aegis]|uniref:perlwapin-like n=1 Tax=Gigantopelta aegis TaxID=1735272 RepID=UPI001B88879F|nr:perlwapin-like [Gigantopelta aegis]